MADGISMRFIRQYDIAEDKKPSLWLSMVIPGPDGDWVVIRTRHESNSQSITYELCLIPEGESVQTMERTWKQDDQPKRFVSEDFGKLTTLGVVH